MKIGTSAGGSFSKIFEMTDNERATDCILQSKQLLNCNLSVFLNAFKLKKGSSSYVNSPAKTDNSG